MSMCTSLSSWDVEQFTETKLCSSMSIYFYALLLLSLRQYLSHIKEVENQSEKREKLYLIK